MELVLVGQLVVSGTQLGDKIVALVQDRRVAMPVAVVRVMVPLKAEEHILTVQLGRLEVRRPDAVVAVAGPDQVAVVAEDVRRCLTGAVHLAGCVGEAGEGSDEEIAFLDVVGRGDGNIELRW